MGRTNNFAGTENRIHKTLDDAKANRAGGEKARIWKVSRPPAIGGIVYVWSGNKQTAISLAADRDGYTANVAERKDPPVPLERLDTEALLAELKRRSNSNGKHHA